MPARIGCKCVSHCPSARLPACLLRPPQEGQPDRFCYGNQKALELFECT